MNFSTLNESSLHKTIKDWYAAQYNGTTESNRDGHVYDILCDDNTVIEIQTKNLSKLFPKLLDAMQKGHPVMLVHPLVLTKTIELYDEEQNRISRRKSPKKGSVYDVFLELTKLYPLLLKESFTLRIIGIKMTEIRVRTEEPVQSKNKRRRFKQNWLKTDKKLDEVVYERDFCTKEDYLNLLPKALPLEFSAKELKECLKKEGESVSPEQNARLIIWVYSRMALLEPCGTKNRFKYYRIKTEKQDCPL